MREREGERERERGRERKREREREREERKREPTMPRCLSLGLHGVGGNWTGGRGRELWLGKCRPGGGGSIITPYIQ